MSSMDNRPLRVCLINLRAYPLFNPDVNATIGGAEVDLYLIATELAKDPYFEVSFVTGDFGQPAQETRQGVRIIKSIDVSSNLFLGAPRLWRALGVAGADVYLDEAASLRTWLDARFCKWKKRPYIFRTAATGECDGTYLREHWFRGRAFNRAIGSAFIIVAQNVSDQENLRRTTGLSSVVIRNACHLAPKKDGPGDTVLWVGRSAPVKGPDKFLQLARQTPDVHFTMICQPAIEDAEFQELADEAATISNLTFLPGIPFQQIGAYFQKARALVNTSVSEGYPNVFVQATSMGVPILSLNVNPDGFLDKFRLGFCANGDWKKFTEMLSELLNPNTHVAFSDNARQYAHQMHDITVIIEKYKALFRCAAGRMETTAPTC